MPSSIRNAIQGFLYDVATFFRNISYRFEDAADWAADIPAIGYYIAYALYKTADYCYDVNYVFKDLMWGWLDLCDWLDHVWDEIFYLWDDLDTLWDYVYTTLKGLVDDAVALATNALNQVTVAYNKAVDAWNYATGWLTDRANEAWNKAVWAYEQIASAVTASAQEIYAWVIGIPAEIKAFVDGVVADIKAWVETYTPIAITAALAALAAPINLINLWFDDIQNFFNDPLGWLWDRFADWFFGPEK